MSNSITISTTSIYQIKDLADISGLSIDDIQDLVETCVIMPNDINATTWIFQEHCLHIAKKAHQLRNDFQLDRNGISLAMTLLNRIEELENQLRVMEAHFGKTQIPAKHSEKDER